MTRLLSRQDVMKVLDMGDVLDILEGAFADYANGKANMPQRTPITAPEHGGLALFMPAYLQGMGALGTKTVTVYKDNPSKFGVPTVLGTILILDEKTGAPVALMDGGYLTAMRTGGVAGLATRLLAKPEATVHCMFGTGGMARTHAWAVDKARDIEKLVLFSLDPVDKRQAFADSLKDIISCEIVLADDPAEAVAQSDIVTLITSAKDPIVQGDWFQPGTHINGVGSHAPHMRELDTLTVQRSRVICDLVDACKAEAGDFMIPAQKGEWSWDQVGGSLGDVITGGIPGRSNADEITLFKSVGLAIQDISVAFHVYKKAQELGVGQDFAFY
jgi:ornithine cyclodeaminase/alanine dehydrogenase-like protein (mu-crystallin family)